MENTLVVIGAVLSSSALTALITQLGSWWREKAARKSKKETAEDKEIAALKAGVMFILYDRIKHIALCHLRDGEISFADRAMLHKMHGVYHDGLGGNGDLDGLMSNVDELPLKG